MLRDHFISFKSITTIIFITIFFISCSRNESAEEISSATWEAEAEVLPISVEVLTVSKGQLIPYIEASGIVYGSQEAWVISESQGKITDVLVTLGQQVKKDDVILKVEDKLAKLNRDLAYQQYESSKLDFEAIESSYKSGGTSRSDYNASRTRVLQAQSSYESANKIYNDTYLRAPFNGSVALLDSALSVGNYISPGARIAKVIDTSSMKMEIALGERQVNLIETGMEAQVNITSQKNEISAFVEAIGSGTESATGSFPVLITWKNNNMEDMRSGLSAQVNIKTKEDDSSIIIPSSAIVVRNRKRAVLIAKNDKSQIKYIETGETLGGHTIVNSGINEGDKLIVSALSSLGEDYSIETTIVGTTGEWR